MFLQKGMLPMVNEKKSISGTYRNALECDAFTKYHSLPVLDAVGYNESYSYADCDAERRKCIKQAYNFAMDRLNTAKDTCIAKECANYYSQQLKAKLLPSLDYLKQLSDKVRLTMVYDTLYKLSQDSKDELLSKYNQELQDNPDYYSLYKIDYFIDKVEIKENDFRISEHPLGRFVERFVTKNIEYYFEGGYEAVMEMEDDLNKVLSTFYKQAHAKYLAYLSSLTPILDVLDREIDTYCQDNAEIQALKERLIMSLS